MLPQDARGEPWLASGWLDVFLQKTVSVFADVSRAGKGPGPASVVGRASALADLVAVAPLEFEAAVIAAIAVDRGFDRAIARFDHTCAAHAGNAAIVGNAGRDAALQPAKRISGRVARIVEAPRPATPIALAQQRTLGRIARGHHQAHVIATRPIKIGLGEGRFR